MGTLNDLMVKVGMNVDEFVSGTVRIAKELDTLATSTERSLKSFDRMGDRLKDIGIGLSAAITAPIAGVGLASLKMAEDFELSMRKVTSLLGTDAAAAFQPLSDGVLELSKRIGVDAVGATNALYEAISAGIPKDNALEFLEVASKAAIAGVTSTKVAVDGMTSAMNAFGLKSSEAQKLADAMFQAVNIGKFSFEQLSAAMGIASGTAAQLKVSYQEVLAAAATITKQGFSVSEAMTMIQSAMTALIKPTAQMNELIKRTGAESGTALIGMKGLEGSLNALATAADGDLTTIAKAFGRLEGTKALLALTGKNAQMAAEDLKGVTNSLGAAGLAFDEIDKSFSRQMDRFNTNLKDIGIQLGTALLPVGQQILEAMKPVVSAIGDVVQWFTKLPAPAQEAGLAIAGVAAATGPMVFVFGQFISMIPNIASAVKVIQELAGSAAVMEGLGAALAIATPLAIAFGIAIAGWAIFKAIQEIQQLDHEMNQLRDTLAAGGAATKQQASEIAALEQTLKSVGKDLPKAFDMNDNLKSVQQYTKELKDAVGGLDQFKGKAIGASDALKGGTINISGAASAYLGLGSAATDAGAKIGEGAKSTAAASRELKEAQKNLNEVQAAFKVGGASIDDVKAATERVRSAFAGLHPELHQTGIRAKEVSDGMAGIQKAFETLNIGDGTKEVTIKIDGLTSALNTLFKAYQQGKISLEQYTDANHAFDTSLKDLDLTTQIAASKAATALAASFQKGLDEIHAKALEPIEVHWEFATADGGENIARLQRIAKAIEPIEVNWKLPDELMASLDEARAKVVSIDDAMKLLGIDNGQAASKAKALADAYDTVAQAAAHGMATQRQADEAQVKSLEAHIAAMKELGQSYDEMGVSIEENKDNLDGLKTKLSGVTEEIKKQKPQLDEMSRAWNQWMDGVSRGVGELAITLGEKLFFGKGSWGEIWKKGLQDIFIAPFESAVKTLITGAIKDLLSGKGLGGILDGLKQIGSAMSGIFGGGASAASGAGSAAGGAASGAGGAAGAAAGVGSLVNTIAGVATAISSIASGITQGLQMAHLISTAGKIEVNTREMSTVMWQTGAESLQGLAKLTYQWIMFANDRLVDIRTALFDPVAKTLEEIRDRIGTVVATTQDVADAVDTGQQAAQQTATATASTADAVVNLSNAVADSSNTNAQQLADATANATAAAQSVQGSVVDSGNGIINALGQSTADQVNATATSTDALLAQLAMIADVTSNAYTDLKGTIKQAGSESLAAQAAAIQRAADEARRLSSIGMNDLEKNGFVDLGSNLVKNWNIPLTQSNNTTGGTDLGSALTVPPSLAQYLTPGTNPGGNSSGFINGSLNQPGYVAPAGTNPGVSFGPLTDAQRYGNTLGAGGRSNSVVQNFFGPITSQELATQVMRQAAEKITVATR